MDRREFHQGVLGAALAMVLPRSVAQAGPHVGPADVDVCRSALTRMYDLDVTKGSAGHVQALAEGMVARLKRSLAHASYSDATGQGLRQVLASAAEHAGWAAYDAGQLRDARRWWDEARLAADLTEFHEVRTLVFASMSLAASSDGDGMGAVQLAEAAQADPTATARVRSILAARLGFGHAVAGDRAASMHAFTQAHRLNEVGPSDDDPAWTGFWSSGADLLSHEVQAAMVLGEFPRAERMAREAVDSAAESGHRRNHALYSVRLAELLAARRDGVAEAVAVATPAVAACRDISSVRLTKGVRRLATRVGRAREGRQFAVWADRMTA